MGHEQQLHHLLTRHMRTQQAAGQFQLLDPTHPAGVGCVGCQLPAAVMQVHVRVQARCGRQAQGYLKDKELDSWGSQAGVHQLSYGAVLQQPGVHRLRLILPLVVVLLLLLLLLPLSVHYVADLVKAIHCKT